MRENTIFNYAVFLKEHQSLEMLKGKNNIPKIYKFSFVLLFKLALH